MRVNTSEEFRAAARISEDDGSEDEEASLPFLNRLTRLYFDGIFLIVPSSATPSKEPSRSKLGLSTLDDEPRPRNRDVLDDELEFPAAPSPAELGLLDLCTLLSGFR